MSRTRKKSLGALWTQLAAAPANVATLKFDPVTGAFKATFRETVDVQLHGEDDPPEEQGDPRFLLESLGNANFRRKAD